MEKPKKCLHCNLFTKKPIKHCPQCGRKLIPTKDFEYPSEFESSKKSFEEKKPEPKVIEKIIIKEPSFLEEKKEYKQEKKKGLSLILVVILIFLALSIIFLFAIPFPYEATEKYYEEVPYDVQVPYADKESYIVTEYVKESVPVNKKDCKTNYMNLENWGNYLISGGNDDSFEECDTITEMQQVEKPVQVTKYKDVTKYRTETRFKQVERTRTVTRYASLINQWSGKAN